MMKIRLECWKTTSVLAVAVLGGCAVSRTPLEPLPQARSIARSWMSTAAKGTDLLYVSVSDPPSVYVFSYPRLALVGTLSVGALGMCTDRKGNIYMTTYDGFEILEFAHGGSSPIATFQDPNGLSYGCSVDPTTGDVAVTNYNMIYGSALFPGNVTVFPKGSVTPVSYQYGNIISYYSCAYDDKGDLFVDGLVWKSSSLLLAKLSKGSGSGAFRHISLRRSLGIPGGLLWKGSVLAIGDRCPSSSSGCSTKTYSDQVVYEFSISGSRGTEVRSTPLAGAGDVPQFAINGKDLVTPNASNWDVSLYPYPAGGRPTQTYSFGTGRSAFGAAVSMRD